MSLDVNVVWRMMPDRFITGGKREWTLFHEMQPTEEPDSSQAIIFWTKQTPQRVQAGVRETTNGHPMSCCRPALEHALAEDPDSYMRPPRACHVEQSSGVSGYCAILL
jgi:hypothetical protein